MGIDIAALDTAGRDELLEHWRSLIGRPPPKHISRSLLIQIIEPPHLNWSSAMFRKRRTDNDEQTTEAGRDYHEVEAS